MHPLLTSFSSSQTAAASFPRRAVGITTKSSRSAKAARSVLCGAFARLVEVKASSSGQVKLRLPRRPYTISGQGCQRARAVQGSDQRLRPAVRDRQRRCTAGHPLHLRRSSSSEILYLFKIAQHNRSSLTHRSKSDLDMRLGLGRNPEGAVWEAGPYGGPQLHPDGYAYSDQGFAPDHGSRHARYYQDDSNTSSYAYQRPNGGCGAEYATPVQYDVASNRPWSSRRASVPRSSCISANVRYGQLATLVDVDVVPHYQPTCQARRAWSRGE